MEASSLAGLSFISSSKSVWARLTWITAFLLSLFLAVYQIDSTFKTWDQNPVSTDIEVLPISGMKLPGITVCPPKGSHTGLNYDLIRAKNITLTTKDRQEMINYAVDQLIIKEAEVYKGFHETFIEEKRQRNWLNGISYITLPGPQEYTFITTALSGSVRTPLFGKKFNQEEFLPQVDWKYLFIYKPTFEINYPDTFLVIDFTFDVTSFGGLESMQLGFIWEKGLRRNWDEKISGTGKIRKKYPMRLFTDDLGDSSAFQINFKRSFIEKNISAWENKRMTGFHAEWHLEDKNGKLMNVSQPSIFTWGRKKLFGEFLSMVNSSISSGRMTAERVMERLKDLKKEWILRNKEKIDEKCTNYDGTTEEYKGQWHRVFRTKSGLTLKMQELEQILLEYSHEMGYWDNATEKREGEFKIIELSIAKLKSTSTHLVGLS